MDRLQAVQGLQIEMLAAHGEVAALHQREAQVARQVGMLEIGFVVGPGREQHDARIGTGRGALAQAVEQRAVSGGQVLHRHLAEGIGKETRNEQPIFEQIAQAGGRLGALRHHPPVALRIARHVERRDVQVRSPHRRHAMHGPQIAGVALHQRAGQQPLGQQLLRAIDVGHDAFEQLGALQHAGFDAAPAMRREDQREEVHGPGALRPMGVGIDVVGDAVVAHLAAQAERAAVQIGKAVLAQMAEEFGPFRREGRGGCSTRSRRGAGGRSRARCSRGGIGRVFGHRHTHAAQLVVVAGQRGRRKRRRKIGRGFRRLGREKGFVGVFHSPGIVG